MYNKHKIKINKKWLRGAVFLCGFVLLFVAGVGNASAATIYSNYSTGNDTTGNGSADTPYKTFHKAYTIASANDTINLTGTFTWTNADETGDASTTGYTIGKNLTITGQLASSTIVQAASSDNTADRRIFTISSGVTATINNLMIRYGKVGSSQDGGGVYINGTATINNCDIGYNRAPDGSGGGVDNRGTLLIQNSTIHHNVASYMGGGLNRDYYSGSGGAPSNSDTLDIVNCTISNNQVTQTVAYLEGAGVFYRRGKGSITNSTISFNTITNGGGTSTHGVGTGDSGSVVQLKNNIIASNTLTNCWSGEIGHRESNGGTFTDNGGNIFGKLGYYRAGLTVAATSWVDQADTCASPDGTFVLQNGSGTSGTLSLNSTLADNSTATGTQTLAITAAGSIAVDRATAGSNGSISVPSTDQRGMARVSTGDIGAFEYGGAPAPSSYTLTYTAGANGSVTGVSPQTVNTGENGSAVTAVPNAHYHFVNWSDASTANPRTDLNVGNDISVTANFAIDTYTLAYTVGAHGTLTGSASQTVNYNASGSAVTAVPATGYHFTSWSDGVLTAQRTDANVVVNLSVSASFAINTYSLAYVAGANGSLTGTTSQTVNYGASGLAVTAVPDSGYNFVSWSDDSTANPRTDSGVTANVSVTASFSTGPIVSTLSPLDNGTNVATDADLVITFDRNVTAAAGKNIVIKKSSDDSTIETVAANNTGKVTISGATATINLATTLSEGVSYYVQIDAGSFIDASNVPYSGVANLTFWNFTTVHATIYVNSTTGNDMTGDGTSGNPFKTFRKGYLVVDADGTLDLTGTFDWTSSGETGDATITGYTIAKNLTITGHNADTTIIQAASADNIADRRVFTISSGVTVTIQNLAMRYGKLTGSSADGGAVKNSGDTIISNCEIYNNRSVGAYGGGLSNWDTLTVNNSSIYNNVAYYMGGGIVNSYYVSADGYLTITNSTIAYNQVTAYMAYTEGGGVHFRKGSGAITNSTIAYNTACGVGGVGMDDPAGTLTMKNSIIAKNFKLVHTNCQNGQGPYDFGYRQAGYGNVVDNGNNIVGYSNRYNFTASTDWVGPVTWGALLSWDGLFHLYGTGTNSALNLDTSLALNDNTNKTKTLALLASSIAINAGAAGSNGTVGVPSTDQRGSSRTSTTDIGAFEYGGAPADTTTPVISGTAASATSSGAVVSWATDELASSQVKYDPNTLVSTTTQVINDSVKTLSHTVTLTNLVACTKYYYIARSQDAGGNIGVSEQLSFSTTGCAGDAAIGDVSEVYATRDDDSTLSQTAGGLNFDLTIPKEFSTDPVNFQMKSLNSTSVINSLAKPVSRTNVGSSVFDVKALSDPSTTISTFDSAVTMTMTYSDSDVVGLDESSLVIYRNDGGDWSALTGCTVNTVANTVTCTTNNFSIFALFGQEQPVSSGSDNGQSGPNTSKDNDKTQLVVKKKAIKKNTVPVVVKSVLFPRDLRFGMKTDDVLILQQYLKDHGIMVPVTGYFGTQTRNAVVRFQKNNRIIPATGYFGIVTRTLINEGKTVGAIKPIVVQKKTVENKPLEKFVETQKTSIKQISPEPISKGVSKSVFGVLKKIFSW